jgi:LuxR family maltose regulon positive regulatory protein
MPETLLRTKMFVPPLRPNLIPRRHLIQQLNQGFQRGHKLTLISAPAGFGKTTLVREWVGDLSLDNGTNSQIANRIGWLSLDENDNDAKRFLSYLITALNQIEGIEAPVGEEALGMLRSPQSGPVKSVLTSLINDVAADPDKFTLVFDDYQLIDSSPVDDALTFLLENLPPRMHLVIATRHDPQLPLARLRARGQLTELRATDLRFSHTEAAEFLNGAMGLSLSERDIATLEKRTEGWIASLQLAAVSLQGRDDPTRLIHAFSGSQRYVLDFLIEEVWEQQTAVVQNFLLETAVLDRLNGPLCDALTRQQNGQEMLEFLEHANLFVVPLDQRRHWYRYHHLFADLLRQRLRQTRPEQLSILQGRASQWYEEEGFIDQAIDHALRGDDYERAASLIEDRFGDNYERRDPPKYQDWLAEMPESFLSTRPDLYILHAWFQFATGQLDEADRSLHEAEELLGVDMAEALSFSLDKKASSEAARLKLGGRAAAIRSLMASYVGDLEAAVRYAHQALELLPEQELAWRSATLITLGDAYADMGQMNAAYEARTDALAVGRASGDTNLLMIVNLRLAEILRQQGELQQVIDICQCQLAMAEESGISEASVVGWLLGIWGEVLAELNQLDRATELSKRGAELSTHGGDLLYEVMNTLCLVRVLFSSGNMADAQVVIDAMKNLAQENALPHWASSQLLAWQARLWLARGNLEQASQWAQALESEPEKELSYPHELEYIALARVLIAQGKPDEASGLLIRLLKAAEAGGRTSSMIEVLILQALSAEARGKTAEAIITLQKAFALAELGGFCRIFLDEGPPLARLLYEANARGIAAAYGRRLLAEFSKAKPPEGSPAKMKTPSSGLVEPLSERELEVLQLIAEGLTGQEIADRLFLSPNTVKVHARNIYGKLDVHHRLGAVTRARALGILPPN